MAYLRLTKLGKETELISYWEEHAFIFLEGYSHIFIDNLKAEIIFLKVITCISL